MLVQALQLQGREVLNKTCMVRDFLQTFFNFSDALPRLEDVLAFVDFSLSQQNIVHSSYGHEEFQNVKGALVSLISQLLEESLRGESSLHCGRDLCNLAIKNKSVIVSTNYDISIDNNIRRLKRSIDYGFKIRSAGELISEPETIGSTEFVHKFEKNNQVPCVQQNTIVPLYKIHGSLNWLYCPRCDEIDLTTWQKGVIFFMKHEQMVHCQNPYCTEFYRDLLVTPTYFKSYNNRILKSIWEKSERALSKATEVVFVGYSLPDADVTIRCLLVRGLARNYQRPKITVVDRSPTNSDVHVRYRRLFGEVEYLAMDLRQYLDSRL